MPSLTPVKGGAAAAGRQENSAIRTAASEYLRMMFLHPMQSVMEPPVFIRFISHACMLKNIVTAFRHTPLPPQPSSSKMVRMIAEDAKAGLRLRIPKTISGMRYDRWEK